MSNPLTIMTKGLTPSKREEFVNSWHNATWLTDPIRDALNHRKAELIDAIINDTPTGRSGLGYFDIGFNKKDELVAEIKVIDYFLRLIPGVDSE